MRLCELRATIRQVRHSHLATTSLQDVIEASKLERGQVISVRITRTVLHGAGHADHLLDASIEGIDFGVGERPIHVVAVERCRTEVDIAKARGAPPPEIRLSTNRI